MGMLVISHTAAYLTGNIMPLDIQNLCLLRQEFHKFPELGFKEDLTKIRVAKFLRKLGLEVHEGIGVIGVLKVGKSNRAIGLRADMDALPIAELSTHNYASQSDGVMHACGHDGHITMLLGAAQKLAEDPGFDGTVIFIFQPNEEHGLGAQAMLEEGIFDKFPVEEIYGIHNLPGAPLGQVSTRVGLICSSESLFEIEIIGKSGHSSMPYLGKDAIIIGAEIIQALQTIVSRKLLPGNGCVVSVTEFVSDGQRNVLSGHAILKGDVRTRSYEDRALIKVFMRQISKGIGSAHGVKIKFTFNTEFSETINAKTPTEAVIRCSEKLGVNVIPEREPMSFSEDFAHFSNVIPGCFFLLGNGETGANSQPLHSANYDFNDDLLPIGVSLWSTLVRDRLPEYKS